MLTQKPNYSILKTKLQLQPNEYSINERNVRGSSLICVRDFLNVHVGLLKLIVWERRNWMSKI